MRIWRLLLLACYYAGTLAFALLCAWWVSFAFPAYGQTPTPLPEDDIDPSLYGLTGWTEQKSGRGASHTKFTKAGEAVTKAIVWGRPHFYQAGGVWRKKVPKLRVSGSDYVSDTNDVVVRLLNTGIELTRDGVGILLQTGGVHPVMVDEHTFTASVGAITLTYYLSLDGVKAEATFASKLGSQTWTVNYTLIGGAADPVVEANGGLNVSGFHIQRPTVRGADGVDYTEAVVGNWSVQTQQQRMSVTLDDTSLPAAALPYVLDPTTVYGSTSDGRMGGFSVTYLTAQTTYDSYAGDGVIGQSLVTGSYAVNRTFLRFDTGSALPDNAIVTAATLSLKAGADDSDTDFDVQIRPYDWGTGSVATEGNDAHYDGCLAASVDQVWRNTSGMALETYYASPGLNTAWIAVDGITEYCLTSSRDAAQTAPSGYERAVVYTAQFGTAEQDPYLTITWSEPPAPGCCNCTGKHPWGTCIQPYLNAQNTPYCPTATPAASPCVYEADSSCAVK